MPRHPLFNDTNIALSATLAATIGLNEAILLTVLNDAASLQSQPWARFNSQVLREQLPFWDDQTIKNILQSLVDQGLLYTQGQPFPETDTLLFNFQGQHNAAPARAHQRTVQQPATSQPWQPQQDTLARLQQHGIEPSFALSHLDAFTIQAKEQNMASTELNARFLGILKANGYMPKTVLAIIESARPFSQQPMKLLLSQTSGNLAKMHLKFYYVTELIHSLLKMQLRNLFYIGVNVAKYITLGTASLFSMFAYSGIVL